MGRGKEAHEGGGVCMHLLSVAQSWSTLYL